MPLYKFDGISKTPTYIGSSVICSFLGLNVLITAAHVLKDILPDIPWYPYSENEFRPLPYIEIGILEDDYDIGICTLKSISELYDPINSITFGEFSKEDNYHHLIIGCPATTTKGSNKTIQKISFEGYLTNTSLESEYVRLKVKNEDKFVLEFQKENVFKENRTKNVFYNPYGMSGGAVLQFCDENPSLFQLVGIIIEWDPHRKNAIICTKIEKVIENFKVSRIDKT